MQTATTAGCELLNLQVVTTAVHDAQIVHRLCFDVRNSFRVELPDFSFHDSEKVAILKKNLVTWNSS